MITEIQLSKKAYEDFARITKKYTGKDFPESDLRSMASLFLQHFGKITRPISRKETTIEKDQ